MGNPRARKLSSIIAMVGLAQNLGALRALTTEGIQRGHMRMHARNVAVQAGATPKEVPAVVSSMCLDSDYSLQFANKALQNLRSRS